MTQMVIGSGVLVKNTMGAAGVVILVIITLIPMMKLVILMLLYQCVAAVLQPVCDKGLYPVFRIWPRDTESESCPSQLIAVRGDHRGGVRLH